MDFKVKVVGYGKKKDKENHLTIGKIYNVSNGVIHDDRGNVFDTWSYTDLGRKDDFESLQKWWSPWYKFELVEDSPIDRHNCFVRCTGYNSRPQGFTIGKVYRVENNTITQDDGFVYSHKCDDMIDWLSPWYSFEVLPQKKTYKIGDRVIASDNIGVNKSNVGTIDKIWCTLDHPYPYRVNFDNGTGRLWSEVHGLIIPVEDKKVFTKKDLQNGDVVLKRNGNVEILILPLGTLVAQHHWNKLDHIRDDLTSSIDSECDIVAVRRPTCDSDCCFDVFESKLGELVYDRERDTVPTMTIEEVEKKYGIKVKCDKNKKCCK